MNQYSSILKKTTLFSGISEEDFSSLLPCLSFQIKDYPKNDFIFRTGDRLSAIDIVLHGIIHIIQEDFWGNQIILVGLQEGDLFAESFRCVEADSASVNLIAICPSKVMFLNPQKLLNVCSSACAFHSRLIQNMIKLLSEKNIFLTERIEYLSKRTTRDKLLSYLSSQAQRAGSSSFHIPFNRQQLADYLCVDRSAMSNELYKLRDKGILSFHKEYFTLYHKSGFFS